MVESFNNKDIWDHLISELQNAMFGANVYAYEALIDDQFKNSMV